ARCRCCAGCRTTTRRGSPRSPPRRWPEAARPPGARSDLPAPVVGGQLAVEHLAGLGVLQLAALELELVAAGPEGLDAAQVRLVGGELGAALGADDLGADVVPGLVLLVDELDVARVDLRHVQRALQREQQAAALLAP